MIRYNQDSIKYFNKLSGIRTIQDISNISNANKKINFNTLSLNTKRLDELEHDVFQNSPVGEWLTVGHAKLKKRATEELVDVLISRRIVMASPKTVDLKLSHNGSVIIEGYLQESRISPLNLGFQIVRVQKHPSGDKLIGVGKLCDKLAVKEANQAGYNKVHLKTGAAGLYSSSEPLHWQRGFKKLEYFSHYNEAQKQEYDAQMQKLFEAYKQGRESGKNIFQSKKKMSEVPMPTVKMALPLDIIQEHIEHSKKIRYA